MQSDDIRTKIKQTTIGRYGVEYISQVEEVKKKMAQTRIKNNTFGNPLDSNDVKEIIEKISKKYNKNELYLWDIYTDDMYFIELV